MTCPLAPWEQKQLATVERDSSRGTHFGSLTVVNDFRSTALVPAAERTSTHLVPVRGRHPKGRAPSA